MKIKLTAKNQLTLPEDVVWYFPGIEFFEVGRENGRIILSPVLPSGDEIREGLAERGITEADIAEAIACVRQRRRSE